MNSTIPSSSDGPESIDYSNINGFRYCIGISTTVVLLITVIVIASYYCTRVTSPSRAQQRSSQSPDDHSISIEVGLDEATLHSYPKLLYSEARLQNKNININNTTTTTCCSICLADYNSTDMLRLLPDCGHLFHLKCVDPWLQQHPTCPVCRSSPIPTPLSTPLAEVVPLSIRTP